MSRGRQAPFILIGILSAIGGVIIAFAYEPVYAYSLEFFRENFGAAAWDEFAVMTAVGMIFCGLFIYMMSIIICRAVLSDFFKGFMGRLKSKQILPAGFKFRRAKGFSGVYSDFAKIMDSFIDIFMTIKKDKDKFSKIVEMHLDPTVKMEMDDRGIDEVYLGGKKKIQTILFADLRGFTSATEEMAPDRVVSILNDYLTESTKIINRNRGKVNKYMGDAVLAVFNEAPKYADYIAADKAVLAALDMQVAFDIILKKWKESTNSGLNLGLGIGISRGEVIAGNVGSEERMEYTVIGDAVNMASRLCSVAKEGQVLISDDVYSYIEHLLEVEALPPAYIKGKKGTYNVYSVKTRRMLI